MTPVGSSRAAREKTLPVQICDCVAAVFERQTEALALVQLRPLGRLELGNDFDASDVIGDVIAEAVQEIQVQVFVLKPRFLLRPRQTYHCHNFVSFFSSKIQNPTRNKFFRFVLISFFENEIFGSILFFLSLRMNLVRFRRVGGGEAGRAVSRARVAGEVD